MSENDQTDSFSHSLRRARGRLLQMHFESGVGHIGGNLSCLDLLMTLHQRVMQAHDVFVLSKGHAAGALYVTLWSQGVLTDTDLRQFHQEGTRLSGHPAPNWRPEICFATGSLGHGLGLSAGIALGKTLQAQPGRVFCLLSDGEWQEGSNWESLLFAAHRRLPLTLLVDANGLQGFGTTTEVAGLEPLAEKLRAFGLPVLEIDGHDPDAIAHACSQTISGPQALIARTRKGNGVSFMEHRLEWHYLPMTAAQYQQAREEVHGG
jgi:transketolase